MPCPVVLVSKYSPHGQRYAMFDEGSLQLSLSGYLGIWKLQSRSASCYADSQAMTLVPERLAVKKVIAKAPKAANIAINWKAKSA